MHPTSSYQEYQLRIFRQILSAAPAPLQWSAADLDALCGLKRAYENIGKGQGLLKA